VGSGPAGKPEGVSHVLQVVADGAYVEGCRFGRVLRA
jgi:hypothetical protein